MRWNSSSTSAKPEMFPRLQPQRSRIQQFRDQHPIGSYLQGEVLSHIDTNRFWVRIGQMTLVALISRTVASGEMLTFFVENLEPEIILKELPTSGLSPVMIARFCQARAHFEQRIDIPKGPNWTTRYLAALKNDPQLLAEFMELRASIGAMNARLDSTQALIYCPWRANGLQQSLCIRTKQSGLVEYLIHGIVNAESIWITLRQSGNLGSIELYVPDNIFETIQANALPSNVRVHPLSRQPLATIWERLVPSGNKQPFHRTV